MPITAAQVESNGWVLRLTVTGSLTSPGTNFGAYVLDQNTTPRLALTTSHPGFVKSGGQAVPGTMLRTLVGLKPLRLPVNPVSPTLQLLDEVDLGGGSIRVRIALSEMIYATDTGLLLSVLTGWRPGEAAASAIAVTNSSTLAAPLPIMRWVLPAYEVATGSFRLSMLVASHHPVGFDPVAGIRFTVTDGTTSKSVWATALSTDNSHGDNLRCHSVIVDPATAVAFTAGLLRCDAEVYPWLGAMRTTDPLGTRSMVGIDTAGFSSNAEAPFVIGYDPAGTRYSNVYAYIDPVNGTATAAGSMIGATRAAAKAVAPASRPRSVTAAIQACRLLNRNPLNRQGAAYNSAGAVDGLVCILAPGTHTDGLGSTAQSSAARTHEIPLIIEGDSDDANPRANCILQTRAAAAQANLAPSRLRLRNLTLEQGQAALCALNYKWLDNVEIRARSGFSASTTSPIGGGVGTDNWNWCLTRSKIWRSAWSLAFNSAGPAPGLLRASEFAGNTSGIVFVKCRTIGSAEDGTIGTGAAQFRMHSASAIYRGKEDVILAFNDCRYLGNGQQAWYTSPVTAALAGALRPSHRRHLIMNNLFEYIGDSQGALFGYGESELVTVSQVIIEGNTTAGAGFNLFYNNPSAFNLTDAATLFNETFNNRLANNAVDRNASKQDDFNDPQIATLRAGASPFGYRPQLVQCWAEHNGCGVEGHVDFGRSGNIGSFRRDGVGLRGDQYPVITTPGYVNDQSYNANPANLGGGNYTPIAGSPMLDRIVRANSDMDLAGNARRMNGASGAYEANVAATTTLVSQNARHVQRTNVTTIGLALAVAPLSARHLTRAGAGGVGLVVPMLPAQSRHVQRAAGSLLGWSGSLSSASTRLASRASTSFLAVAGALQPGKAVMLITSPSVTVQATDTSLLLGPGNSRLALSSTRPRLIPKRIAPFEQTLLVGNDPRQNFITQTEQEI